MKILLVFFAKQVDYLPRTQVVSKCDMRIDDAGVIREIGSGANTLQGWSSFVSKVAYLCSYKEMMSFKRTNDA